MLSCRKVEHEPITVKRDIVRVGLYVIPADIIPVARSSMNENAIADVNLYLYGIINSNSYYLYTTDTDNLSIEVIPGDYRMYVIANIHESFWVVPESDFEDYMIANIPSTDIAMVAIQEVSIYPSGNNGTLTLEPVVVERCAARISYNIQIAPSVTGMELLSVKLCNAPLCIYAFQNENELSTSIPSNYYDTSPFALSGTPGSGVFYMLENKQGVKSAIIYQMDKNKANAPACATYLNIKANHNGTVLDFFVYLGENNTSDFNVRRNTCHVMNIEIRGADLVDTRIERDIVISIADGNLSDIELICSGAYSVNNISRQFVVPYNSTCTFTATNADTFLGWYDGTGSDANLLSNTRTVTVNPTNDIVLYPKYYVKIVNTIRRSSVRESMSYKVTLTADYPAASDVKINFSYTEEYRNFLDDREDQTYYYDNIYTIKAGERSVSFYEPIDNYGSTYENRYYLNPYLLLTPSDDVYVYQFWNN